MIRSIYTVNRNMNVLRKKQENASANIANANTPGYKFQDIVQSTLESHEMFNYSDGIKLDKRQDVGEFVFGNQIDEFYRDYGQGQVYHTDKSTDFAVVGEGFFTVQLDDGQFAYTRNGNFKVNDDGVLVTAQGYPVLAIGNDGEISNIHVVNDKITATDTGYIPEIDGYFLITDFEDYGELESIGETYFIGGQPQNMQGVQMRQGYLEMSNVKLAEEMVKLIEISREFESNQKVLQASDETLSQAVNEVGKV